jgi:hypothetical protein
MSIPSRVRTPLTLEQFLKLPEIDEHPAREYIELSVATVFSWLKLRIVRPRGGEQTGHGGPMS